MSIDKSLGARERDFSSARFRVLEASALADDLGLNLKGPALEARGAFEGPVRSAQPIMRTPQGSRPSPV